MAVLTLTKVWVNLVPDGTPLSAPSAPDRTRGAGVEGDVQAFAGGRLRAITQEGVKGRFNFTLIRLTLAQVLTLEDWMGRTVLVRDHRGQKFYGTYFDVDTGEYKDGLYRCAIQLRTVTFEEGV